jgi:hypothetical protein
MAARHVGGNPVKGVRKVRAPQRRVAGNARPSRDEDQCHSDDADHRREPAVGVKRGKLHPEQGQIGGRNPCGATRRGRGALPSPRVGRKSRRATGGPRRMAIPARSFGAGRDRTRLTDRLADIPAPPCDEHAPGDAPCRSGMNSSISERDRGPIEGRSSAFDPESMPLRHGRSPGPG